jgi:hypothetical protein
MGLEPTTGFPEPHFQSESSADAVSDASFCAPSSYDENLNAMQGHGDALVTVEPSAQGHYWPDDVDAGDGAFEQVKSAWPFLPRNLRLAIVAIAKLLEQSTLDHDGIDEALVDYPDDIPF